MRSWVTFEREVCTFRSTVADISWAVRTGMNEMDGKLWKDMGFIPLEIFWRNRGQKRGRG